MKAARTDANHTALVQAYKDAGWSVLSLAKVGDGCPDLLLCDRTRTRLHLVEVKTETGRLTPDQAIFSLCWPVRVVRSVEDVRQHVQAVTESVSS